MYALKALKSELGSSSLSEWQQIAGHKRSSSASQAKKNEKKPQITRAMKSVPSLSVSRSLVMYLSLSLCSPVLLLICSCSFVYLSLSLSVALFLSLNIDMSASMSCHAM